MHVGFDEKIENNKKNRIKLKTWGGNCRKIIFFVKKSKIGQLY